MVSVSSTEALANTDAIACAATSRVSFGTGGPAASVPPITRGGYSWESPPCVSAQTTESKSPMRSRNPLAVPPMRASKDLTKDLDREDGSSMSNLHGAWISVCAISRAAASSSGPGARQVKVRGVNVCCSFISFPTVFETHHLAGNGISLLKSQSAVNKSVMYVPVSAPHSSDVTCAAISPSRVAFVEALRLNNASQTWTMSFRSAKTNGPP
jgi:hypothetical protein